MKHIITGGLFVLAFIGGSLTGYELKTAEVKFVEVIKTKKIVQLQTRTVYLPPGESPIYIPPEGGVVITPKDPTKTLGDVVDIQVNRMGLIHELGVFASYPKGIGLDMKWFYIERFGLEVGARIDNHKTVSPTFGGSYRLDRSSWLKNTEFACGWAPINYFSTWCGLRLNL